jgi:hypothetical protein
VLQEERVRELVQVVGREALVPVVVLVQVLVAVLVEA